jgi:hypothetical protein
MKRDQSANLLEMKLLKIGQILSTQRVVSSFWTALPVWNIYSALAEHFRIASLDATYRDLNERSMYDELMKNIIPTEFLLDLSLMCDVLQEL